MFVSIFNFYRVEIIIFSVYQYGWVVQQAHGDQRTTFRLWGVTSLFPLLAPGVSFEYSGFRSKLQFSRPTSPLDFLIFLNVSTIRGKGDLLSDSKVKKNIFLPIHNMTSR